MTEADAVARAINGPATVQSLTEDLFALGVRPGMVLLAHSSLSALGWVCGGPVAVILALEAALGPAGTLVMPAHSGDYSEPSVWQHPPVPEGWWQTFKDVALDSDDFEALGAAFERDTALVRVGRVACGKARLMSQRVLVDYGVRWMESNRR